MSDRADAGFRVRPATIADVPVLARHRAAMFRDMGQLAAESEPGLIKATADYLQDALPHGEYLGWVAESADLTAKCIGGAGVQLRPILPRPRPAGDGIEFGPEAIILNVYVDSAWRRRGVGKGLMVAVLTALTERKVRRVVLHASDEGRRLYQRLGFVPTNELRLK